MPLTKNNEPQLPLEASLEGSIDYGKAASTKLMRTNLWRTKIEQIKGCMFLIKA